MIRERNFTVATIAPPTTFTEETPVAAAAVEGAEGAVPVEGEEEGAAAPAAGAVAAPGAAAPAATGKTPPLAKRASRAGRRDSRSEGGAYLFRFLFSDI